MCLQVLRERIVDSGYSSEHSNTSALYTSLGKVGAQQYSYLSVLNTISNCHSIYIFFSNAQTGELGFLKIRTIALSNFEDPHNCVLF